MSATDYSDFSMLELFRIEVDNQSKILTSGLLALENGDGSAAQTEELMRAAHSLKGAARIVDVSAAVRVAHGMEDCFVAAQKGKMNLGRRGIDLLLGGVDLLVKIAQTSEPEVMRWENEQKGEIDSFVEELSQLVGSGGEKAPVQSPPPVSVTTQMEPSSNRSIELPLETAMSISTPAAAKEPDRMLRVTADHLDRLLGLAGESLVESHRLNPFADSLLRLKRQHGELAKMLEAYRETLPNQGDEEAYLRLNSLRKKVADCRDFLSDRLVELELFDRRSGNLSHRLYEEALACRMRPFADGIHGFPRMVRDVARSLGKEVNLEIAGEATRVDRDMLEKLEAPLTHLLRNAVDHGLEFPEQRVQSGKRSEGVVRLEARHSAGMLQIVVSDDGRGIDPERLRQAIISRKLASPEIAGKLSEAELLEFLFLPGFTMKESVTEISGRGVGLDAVQNMVERVRGTVRIFSEIGRGTRFQLQLPLTLSVARTLLVEIGDEPYAFPLAYITSTLKLSRGQIEMLEGHGHFSFNGRQIGLVTARQVLGLAEAASSEEQLPVIVVENRSQVYGVVVDRFLGERELVVLPLDPRLGKIKDISAGALMEDGSPALIVDVEDLVHSIDKLISSGSLSKVPGRGALASGKKWKRILVVDDSLTVRELERKLLTAQDYEVEVAVDGMDAWNMVRAGRFDLMISDIDMPRMDGIELVTLVKKDRQTKSLPVMIVSYKDREEDRRRGLEAGADYYLTKGTFDDATLINAVRDMIGEASA